MDRRIFTDILFDLLNESDLLDAAELTASRASGQLDITVYDGTRFIISIKPAEEADS